GAGGGVRRAPRGGLRAHPPVPRRTLHGGEPRGEVQGQESHRHFRVPRRGRVEWLALQGLHPRLRCGTFGGGLAWGGDLGGVDDARGRARPCPGARARSCAVPAARTGGRTARRSALGSRDPRLQAALDWVSEVAPAVSSAATAMISAALSKRSPR